MTKEKLMFDLEKAIQFLCEHEDIEVADNLRKDLEWLETHDPEDMEREEVEKCYICGDLPDESKWICSRCQPEK